MPENYSALFPSLPVSLRLLSCPLPSISSLLLIILQRKRKMWKLTIRVIRDFVSTDMSRAWGTHCWVDGDTPQVFISVNLNEFDLANGWSKISNLLFYQICHPFSVNWPTISSAFGLVVSFWNLDPTLKECIVSTVKLQYLVCGIIFQQRQDLLEVGYPKQTDGPRTANVGIRL